MPRQVEDLHYSVPDCLALECLGNGYTLDVVRLSPVQLMDHVSQFVNIAHRSISKKQTLKSLFAELPLFQFCSISEPKNTAAFRI